MPVSAAMSAKVGAAPSDSQSAARSVEFAIVMAASRCSAPVVLVAAPPPDAALAAPLGGAIEPLVCAPQAVEPTGVGGIGVVDGAVLAHEGAHARPVAPVGGRIDAARFRELDDRRRGDIGVQRVGAARVVVLGAALALLFFGDRDAEVEIEVAAVRGRPGEGPAHPL